MLWQPKAGKELLEEVEEEKKAQSKEKLQPNITNS